jgi:hypothetical protein
MAISQVRVVATIIQATKIKAESGTRSPGEKRDIHT